jgi:DNA-binding response OmpR family regulator
MDKTKILIVDDDPKISQLVQIFLEQTKLYDVKVENRSRQALAVAREFRPRLVLLDVDMPGMDGGEVSRQLRADTSLKDVPILFCTSLVASDDVGTKLVKRGRDYFLAKPVEQVSLVRSVAAMLAGKPALAA